MRILLNVSRAGERINQPAGTIVDLPEAEARRLLAAGKAERLNPAPEQATVAPPRTAMRAPGKPREASHRMVT